MNNVLEKKFDGDIMMMRLVGERCSLRHEHKFLELAYIENGSAQHDIGGVAGELRQGNYFVVDYNTSHSYFSANGDITVINCLFMPEFIDKNFSGVKSFNELAERYFMNITGRKIKGPSSNQVFTDDGTVGVMLKCMTEEFSEKKDGYLEMLRYALCQILIKTIRQVGSDRAVSDITAYITDTVKKKYMEHISLETLCSNTNYSLPYISAKFKEETGITFTEYLQNKRIEESCRLLFESDGSISEIAEQVGYNSVKFFNKVFRRVTKMSPREYRRQSMSRR